MATNYNLSTGHLPSKAMAMVHSYIPPSLQPFITLSYPLPASTAHPHTIAHGLRKQFFSFAQNHAIPTHSPTLYDKGSKDVYFVAFCAVGFTVLRQVMMTYVFEPFARSQLEPQPSPAITQDKGKGKRDGMVMTMSKRERRRLGRTVLRFAEQSWSCLYCTVFWSLGLKTLYQIPSPTSPTQLWGTYPYHPISALTKFYYLAQLGWWFHQIYVIHTEKRRKDHYQMFSHHILTITLMVSSYLANFTRVGVVVHVLMDFCDIWLPLAKMFRYLGYSQLCDLTFVIFLVGWLFSRQIGLFLLIKSVYIESPKYIPLEWAPTQGRYYPPWAYWGFLGMLSALWIMASVWFIMAVNVALRVVRGLGAEDTRSDDEDDEASTSPTPSPIEEVPQCVGVSSSVLENEGQDSEGLRKR